MFTQQISNLWFLGLICFSIICLFNIFEYTTLLPSRGVPVRRPSDSEASYTLVDSYKGITFFDGFNFEAIADPTHGHVQYLSKDAAMLKNLTYLGNDGVSYIHTDFTEYAPQGRKSVRLSSKKTYTHGLFVLDVIHMPVGCGTWPAFWTTARDSWPEKGEIDIIEGVNLEKDNAFTLHTGKDCKMAQIRKQNGRTETMDCDVQAWNQWPNQGCGVKTQNSFGHEFNQDGGAFVVMEWTSEQIRMWIIRRDSPTFDQSKIIEQVNADLFGTPDAVFDATSCDIARIFRDHVVIINVSVHSAIRSLGLRVIDHLMW